MCDLSDTILPPRPADDFVVDWDLKESLVENHERVSKALRKEKKKGRRSGEQGETEPLEKVRDEKEPPPQPRRF